MNQSQIKNANFRIKFDYLKVLLEIFFLNQMVDYQNCGFCFILFI